jgi:hypothetical protein
MMNGLESRSERHRLKSALARPGRLTCDGGT